MHPRKKKQKNKTKRNIFKIPNSYNTLHEDFALTYFLISELELYYQLCMRFSRLWNKEGAAGMQSLTLSTLKAIMFCSRGKVIAATCIKCSMTNIYKVLTVYSAKPKKKVSKCQ